MDTWISTSAWLGAYQQAMAEHGDSDKAVYAEANIPAELIEKHTKTTAVITLKVTAR